ncbi:MAG: hypothetical protein IPM80_16435 [Proteobacteria bacterium]|nr:hypothetical protein [Pseudomonadota bacterium]
MKGATPVRHAPRPDAARDGLNALGLLQSVSAYEASLRHLVDFPGLLMNGMLSLLLFAAPRKPLPMTTTSKGSFMRACSSREFSLSTSMT